MFGLKPYSAPMAGRNCCFVGWQQPKRIHKEELHRMVLQRTRRLFTTVAALICAASFGIAQQKPSLTLRVIDAQGSAVPFARVAIYSQGSSLPVRGSTDATGLYDLALPSSDTVLIE